MVLHDFFCDRQSQSRAVFFSMTHEGMKYLVSYRHVESRTVIDNANIEMISAVLHRDRDMSTFGLYRLTRVQQQVVENPFHLAGIAHRVVHSAGGDDERDLLEFGMRVDQLDRAAYGMFDRVSVKFSDSAGRDNS